MAERWTPTAENINALPEPVKCYIHDLETRADPAYDVQNLALAQENVCGLERRVVELTAILRLIVKAAPTEEPEYYDGFNTGDCYDSGWKRCHYRDAEIARTGLGEEQ